MARKTYVQINGKLVDKDELAVAEHTHMVSGDLPDFVSPIDGKTYSGRAGLREHCKVHRVVPNAELAGLPPLPMHRPYQPSQQEREATKRTMYQIMSDRRYFDGR